MAAVKKKTAETADAPDTGTIPGLVDPDPDRAEGEPEVVEAAPGAPEHPVTDGTPEQVAEVTDESSEDVLAESFATPMDKETSLPLPPVPTDNLPAPEAETVETPAHVVDRSGAYMDPDVGEPTGIPIGDYRQKAIITNGDIAQADALIQRDGNLELDSPKADASGFFGAPPEDVEVEPAEDAPDPGFTPPLPVGSDGVESEYLHVDSLDEALADPTAALI